MAYTALKKMQGENIRRFGRELGPFQPPLYCSADNPNDLKSAVLRFIHERCEELLFDGNADSEEERIGCYKGRSIANNQIPYNMEKDIDRMCLEKALESFIDSGIADDAYTVYYAYIEMFVGRYGNSKKMVELLSEYEINGSSLLLKHRDHYSHSVYVFALGLAIYECSSKYRAIFKKFYGLDLSESKEAEKIAANMYLEFWGLTSLFHDIGYPFELPFEQVLSYFEVDNKERGKDSLYLAYRSVESLTVLDDTAKQHFEELYGEKFETSSELIAHDITEKLGKEYGFSESYMREKINTKPTDPENFGYFMDHAFFSASRLYDELAETLGANNLTRMHVDALSAIMLHNSLFKFAISFYKDKNKRKEPLNAELHPLAYMLMLCDELQCWDRTAYGRNSRTELQPMSADFDFSGGAINAKYYYDMDEADKIADFKVSYNAWEAGGEQGKPPRLKAYSDMAEKEQRFTRDIEKIVDMNLIPLTVTPDMKVVDRSSKHIYLSNSNFLHLFDFAVALHGRNKPQEITTAELEDSFESLSLEYQISGINRAKWFGRYLNSIGCFYTDRPVDFEMVNEFSPIQAAAIAPMEHERWVVEHHNMGWVYGEEYNTLILPEKIEDEKEYRKALREQLRCHRLAMDGEPTEEQIKRHYFSLPDEDQDKDWKPFNSMLKLLKKYDGLRIYKL